jgi:hypothetical protein
VLTRKEWILTKMAREKYTILFMKITTERILFILVNHIKLVKYTMVLQQWTGWLKSKKEITTMLQLVTVEFSNYRKTFTGTLPITLI